MRRKRNDKNRTVVLRAEELSKGYIPSPVPERQTSLILVPLGSCAETYLCLLNLST